MIKDLLLSNQTDKALSKIEQMIRTPCDQKEKDNLTKLYTYISRNRQGITNQVFLKGPRNTEDRGNRVKHKSGDCFSF